MHSGSTGLSSPECTISVWFGFREKEDGNPQRDFLLTKGAAQSTWHRGLAQGGTVWQVLWPCCGHSSVCVLVLVPMSPPSPSSFLKVEYNNDKMCVPAVRMYSNLQGPSVAWTVPQTLGLQRGGNTQVLKLLGSPETRPHNVIECRGIGRGTDFYFFCPAPYSK